MSETIHGIPLTFQRVGDEDQTFQPSGVTYRDQKKRWIDYLTGSDAVKKAAPRIAKMHIGTLAHFYFTDSDIPFNCKAHDRSTTITRCEDCPDWSRPDNVCQVDGIGAYIEKQPPTKDIALDTMHILRLTLKEN